MHQRMSVDIETYSSIDLTKSGVYKYTEAPDFDILLIGYSFDDEEEVQVIDTYNLDEEGRAMMTEFMDALHNPRIIKTAFNANFERTCLAKWTEKEMPPANSPQVPRKRTCGLRTGQAIESLQKPTPAKTMWNMQKSMHRV